MKLLFIVRKVDKGDAVAGFLYQWIIRLSGQVAQLFVICLEQGDISGLPANVQVHSLGKERGKNRWREFWLFQKYLMQLVPRVDGVWAHQNPEYSILAAPWTRIFGKRLVSWYAHGTVNWKVRLMTTLTNKVATSSAQGFLLPTKKLIILHQGIDTELFNFQPKPRNNQFRIITVGRLTPSKRLEVLIDVMASPLIRAIPQVQMSLIGEVARDGDQEYQQALVEQIERQGLGSAVQVVPAVPNRQLPQVYHQADLLINCSKTGSLDKVVLEAMACGTLVLTTNIAFKDVFKDFSLDLFSASDDQLESKVQQLIQLSSDERLAIQQKLRAIILEQHDLNDLVQKIVNQFKD